jgi:hypothetical protein
MWLAMAPVVMVESVAEAQSEEEIARARDQYRKGLGLEAAGDWAGALAQFEAVARVRMTPAVRFHIARCQHNLGNLLEALGGYRLAAHEASQDPKSAETLTEARLGIEEVEAMIPKLVIERGAGAEAAAVTLDGVSLGDTSIGKEVPVNPGAHTIKYTLPDGRTEQRVVRVKERESKKVVLTFTPEDPEGSEKDESSTTTVEEGGSSALPWVMVGIGGASLVTSGVFYLMRSSTISDHEDQCVNNVCPSSLEDTGNKGKTYGTVGNITLGVGVLGLGIGTILLLTEGGSTGPEKSATQRKPPQPSMTVVVGGNGRGAEASLVGTF